LFLNVIITNFGLNGFAFYAHDITLACLAYRTEACFINGNSGDLRLPLYSASQWWHGILHSHVFCAFSELREGEKMITPYLAGK